MQNSAVAIQSWFPNCPSVGLLRGLSSSCAISSCSNEARNPLPDEKRLVDVHKVTSVVYVLD